MRKWNKNKKKFDSRTEKRIFAFLKKGDLSSDKLSPINNVIIGNKEDESIVYVSGEQGSGKTTVARAAYKLKHPLFMDALLFMVKILLVFGVIGFVSSPFLISGVAYDWSILPTLISFIVWFLILTAVFFGRTKIPTMLVALNSSYIPIDLWSVFKDYEHDEAMGSEEFKKYIFIRLWRSILLKIGFIPKAIEHFRLAMEYENINTSVKHFSKSFIAFLFVPLLFVGLFIGLSFIDGWHSEMSWIGGTSSIIIYIASLFVIDINVKKSLGKIYEEGISNSLIPEILSKKSKYRQIYIHFMDLDRINKILVGQIVHEISTLYKAKNVSIMVELDDKSEKEILRYIVDDLGVKEQYSKEYLLKLTGNVIKVKSLSMDGFKSILRDRDYNHLNENDLSLHLFDAASSNSMNSYRYKNNIVASFDSINIPNNNAGINDYFNKYDFYKGFSIRVISNIITELETPKYDDTPFKNNKNKWDMKSVYSPDTITLAFETIKFLNFEDAIFFGNIAFDKEYITELLTKPIDIINSIWDCVGDKQKIYELPLGEVELSGNIEKYVFNSVNYIKYAFTEEGGDSELKKTSKTISLFYASPEKFSILILNLSEERRKQVLKLLAMQLPDYNDVSKDLFDEMNEDVPSKMISPSKMSNSQKVSYVSTNKHKHDTINVLENIFEITGKNFLGTILEQVDDVEQPLYGFIYERINSLDREQLVLNKNLFDVEDYVDVFSQLNTFDGAEVDKDFPLDLNEKIIIENGYATKLGRALEWAGESEPSSETIDKLLNKLVKLKDWNGVVNIVNDYGNLVEESAVNNINANMPVEFFKGINNIDIKWDKGIEYFGIYSEEWGTEYKTLLEAATKTNASRNIENLEIVNKYVKRALAYGLTVSRLDFSIDKIIKDHLNEVSILVPNDMGMILWTTQKLNRLRELIHQLEKNKSDYIKEYVALIEEQDKYVVDTSGIKDKKIKSHIDKWVNAFKRN